MLWGLGRLTGVSASLMLNLEGPFTVLIAVLIFREHMGRYAWFALACVFGGSFLLAVVEGTPEQPRSDVLGAMALAGACLAWAIDNNLTQKLSLKDPFVIARAKTLGAGVGMLAIALLTGRHLPETRTVIMALILGSLSYGASIVLDAYALRHLGAVREAAYFATAPFVGAIAALPILGEGLSWPQVAAGLSMALGVVALLRERHGHLHAHEALTHEHLHFHDEHHRHVHAGPHGEPHSHVHTHEPLTHDHPHVPDLHHRHRH
jgi:drug/metabolite transporter (DMT)-like permease